MPFFIERTNFPGKNDVRRLRHLEGLAVYLKDNLLGLIGTLLGIINLFYIIRGNLTKKQLQIEIANLEWCTLREIERGDFFSCGGTDNDENEGEFNLDVYFYNLGAKVMLISEVTMEVRLKETNFIVLKLQDAMINPLDLIELMPGAKAHKRFSVKMSNKLFICREVGRFENHRALIKVRTSDGKLYRKRIL